MSFIPIKTFREKISMENDNFYHYIFLGLAIGYLIVTLLETFLRIKSKLMC